MLFYSYCFNYAIYKYFLNKKNVKIFKNNVVLKNK